ncbi:MAG: hypothetical protein KDA57_24135, partial [Planctomycetales bacterium]|nr:hypothetical protein [Planctomycetales bacterium]
MILASLLDLGVDRAPIDRALAELGLEGVAI